MASRPSSANEEGRRVTAFSRSSSVAVRFVSLVSFSLRFFSCSSPDAASGHDRAALAQDRIAGARAGGQDKMDASARPAALFSVPRSLSLSCSPKALPTPSFS